MRHQHNPEYKIYVGQQTSGFFVEITDFFILN